MKSIELNPDGTFPYQQSKAESASSDVTITSTSFDRDFIPDPPKKRTWKEIGKGLLGYYLLLAIAIGTGQIVGWLIIGVTKLISRL